MYRCQHETVLKKKTHVQNTWIMYNTQFSFLPLYFVCATGSGAAAAQTAAHSPVSTVVVGSILDTGRLEILPWAPRFKQPNLATRPWHAQACGCPWDSL